MNSIHFTYCAFNFILTPPKPPNRNFFSSKDFALTKKAYDLVNSYFGKKITN